ncbi:MAG TPA: plastocyanin/azurin family copper-binding protein [Gaiellaceae bacterium]|nr:plastocyanin/azurin family copper-binding protein [Gaiellaceae bacterium]
MKLLLTFAVAAAALAMAATASPMAAPKLTGTVGPGFTISLKKAGKAVRTLKAGRYTFVVSDKAAIHNFEIEGPKLHREITSVSFRGRKTVTLTLRKGTYKYYCAPHESTMHGSFRVT